MEKMMKNQFGLLSMMALAATALPFGAGIVAQEAVKQASRDPGAAAVNANDNRARQTDADARQRKGRRQQARSQHSADASQSPHQIRGTVLELRRIERPQSDATYIAALVRMEDDRRVPVALGKAETIEKLDLQKGDRLRVRGQVISRGGRPLFVAHSAKANGQSTKVDHPRFKQQQSASRNAEQKRATKLRGTIEQMRQVPARGDKPETLAAFIRRPDGIRVSANLGSARRLASLDLNEGDRVILTGQVYNSVAGSLFVADSVRTKRGRVQINTDQRIGYRPFVPDWADAEPDDADRPRPRGDYSAIYDDNLLNTMEFPTADGTLYEWEVDERTGDLQFEPFFK